MKLWLLTQMANNDFGTFDLCVVAADTAEEAIKLGPGVQPGDGFLPISAEDVVCQLLGEAGDDIHRGIIVASYNPG